MILGDSTRMGTRPCAPGNAALEKGPKDHHIAPAHPSI